MSVCGLWTSPKRLFAVLIDDTGRARPPISAPPTPQARAALLNWLATCAVDAVVLGERNRDLIDLAHVLRLHVEIAPAELLHAIRHAAGLTQRPPRHTAVLLARWYLTPALRRYLRAPPPSPPLDRQLPLL